MSSKIPKYDWGLFQWPDESRARRWTVSFGGLGTIFGAILIISGLLAVPWVCWRFLEALYNGDDEAIRNVGIIFLALYGAPFVIWRAIVAQGNLDRSRDRDYADLFTKAVDQLGATREVKDWDDNTDREIFLLKPNIEVRLGAIYALERISNDSERDHIAVMETLAAYVRENAPIDLLPAHPNDGFDETGEVTNTYQYWLDGEENGICHDHQPRKDIQAVMTVIGRRSPSMIEIEEKNNFLIDLRSSNLVGAILTYGNYSLIDFSYSRMENTKFYDSILKYTKFTGAKLAHTDFYLSVLEVCDFDNGDLSHAKFAGASIYSSNFSHSKLCFSDFGGSQFNQCRFKYANLQNSSFQYSKMNGCDFISADLRNAKSVNNSIIVENITSDDTILPDELTSSRE